MIKKIFPLFLALPGITGFSQNTGFEYNGRSTRTVKMERLNYAVVVSEIVPEFWQNLGLPYQDRQELNLRKNMDYDQRFSPTPKSFDYRKIMEIVSSEITIIRHGNSITTKSTGELLTPELRNNLTNADPGSPIEVNVKIKYKADANNGQGNESKIIDGGLVAVLVPDTEAEYAGGFKQMSEYFTNNVIKKISEPAIDKLRMAVVKFTVDEEGKVVDAKIARSTNDPALDKLLLDATNKMPQWTPAVNSKGMKVKQEFSIPFGNEGC